MTLVTDAGYGSHDEIVWESLVDVNGSASEMFSGDFRVVSHDQNATANLNQGNSAGGEEGWQTVERRNQYHSQQSQNRQGPMRVSNGTDRDGHETPPPLPSRPASRQHGDAALGMSDGVQRTTSEQEDHDLALALQLQEEEEDQQRQAEQRRRREHELSERFLSSESSSPEGPRPPIPPRRSGMNQQRASQVPNQRRTSQAPTGGRPPVTRQQDAGNGDGVEAPPTYEQSASDRPYRPAGSTAANGMQQGNPLNAYDALRRQQSAYTQQSSGLVDNASNSPPSQYGHNRRQSGSGRIRRRSSQLVGPSSGVPPGAYAPGRPGVAGGAAGIRDAEDKCVVM